MYLSSIALKNIMRKQSAARKSPLIESSYDTDKGQDTIQKYNKTLSEELVFAFCSPIGSLKSPVIDSIEKRIKNYGYIVERIKLSSLFNIDPKKIQLEPGKSKGYVEMMAKINEGDRLRATYGLNSILADLAIQKILFNRLASSKDIESIKQGSRIDPTNLESKKVCYLIDSLKNLDELKLLRSIYRDNFYLISVFSPLIERKANLRNEKKLNDEEIDHLIDTDDKEELIHGQNVRDTFLEADFFVRVSKLKKLDIDKKIKRFLHLVFESEVITPLPKETAMYAAQSASCNSGCLSRQVGAAITDCDGNVLATGWNDVPRFGGDLYKEGDKCDNRCLKQGFCSNNQGKTKLIDEIINFMTADEKLGSIINKNGTTTFEEISKTFAKILSKTDIRNLLEYSRAVHAEMHAIIKGSQLTGDKMKNGKLFVTTYPCHHCARHILLAGIKEIYYIEPYAKSLCLSLHEDSFTESEEDVLTEGKGKVKLLLYDGVAPRSYLDLFTMSSRTARKETANGIKISNKLNSYSPRKRITLQALSTLEEQSVFTLQEKGYYEKEGIN